MSLVEKFCIFAAVVAAWYTFWVLAGSIFIIVVVWSLIRSSKELKAEQQKERSEKEQRRERFEKEVKQLRSKVNKGLNKLLDEEMGIFSSAYRSSVSTNSFGKKDYSKFIKEMEEYLNDNLEALRQIQELKIKFQEEYEVEITIPFDAIIDCVEEGINESV